MATWKKVLHESSSASDFPTLNQATTQNAGTVTNGVYTTTASTAGLAFVKDEDDMTSDSATHIPTQQSVKAYVDAQVDTADSVSELGDTTIASIADHDLLAYDSASSKWINMSKAEAGITQVTVDTSLSDGSVNPVTNNAVFDGLATKQATITGGATTIASSDLTASRALTSNGSGKVAVSAVTSTELGYLDGVTSAIQTQMDAKAPTADPTFTGTVTCVDLTVTGTTTTLKTQNVEIEDKILTLGVPSSGTGDTTSGTASGLHIDTASAVLNRPTFQWKKDMGAGNTDGSATGNYLTGWLLSNHRTSNHVNHAIAIMDFKDTSGEPSGNSAGVGSFTYNTNEDALYLRTA